MGVAIGGTSGEILGAQRVQIATPGALYHFERTAKPLICLALCNCCTVLNIRMVPRAGVEPARPFSGKRRILSPQCLPISPSGRRLLSAYLRCSVTRAAHARNALSYLWSGPLFENSTLRTTKKKGKPKLPFKFGAGKESRTLDLNLGKVALYQLSYSRVF